MESKMAKKDTVAVILLCVRCGDGQTDNPGDLIHVDAEEAERLIEIKAAKKAPESK
jgi:hypothetical protein